MKIDVDVELKLIVEASLFNALFTTSATKVLTVRKIDNGPPDIETNEENDKFSVSIKEGSDPDGDITTASYQWQRLDYNAGNPQWSNVDSQPSTGNTLTFDDQRLLTPSSPSDRVGSLRYRVQVTYLDAQGYETVELIPLAYRGDADADDDRLIEIYYLEDLDAIRYQLDGRGYRANSAADLEVTGCLETPCDGYELVRSLDFNDDKSYVSTSNKVLWTSGVGWQPIGDLDEPFDARFVSADTLVISNLFINRPDEDYVGLFGVSNGQISGLNLQDVDIKGRFIVGGITGVSLEPSMISDSSVDGTVSGSDAWVGGLVGVHNGSIANSHARGEVIGNTSVGGLAGYALGPIADSYAHSNISSQAYGGGLVGYHQGQQGISGINDSYASGSVEGVFYVGGLVGYNDGGIITNAYALGDVVGGTNVGGLVGYNDGGVITTATGVGNVAGANNVGDLAGSVNGGSITGDAMIPDQQDIADR